MGDRQGGSYDPSGSPPQSCYTTQYSTHLLLLFLLQNKLSLFLVIYIHGGPKIHYRVIIL